MPKLMKGHKLSPKQEAVIRDVVKSVRDGEKFSVARSVERIYNVKHTTAAVAASKNMANQDFREALMNALEERKIIGADSKVEQRLAEGLDAEDKDGVDFKTRLSYIQEINKIAGLYAPEKHESRKMTLNLNMTKEELKGKIQELKEELG